ncbi:VWA domain-containing protein [Occultella glacieicola]|uniref:VWA domain-containing protein n=1 Tax=Occultella glacieicola TaxID=2518684 RepID=A0ABY2E6J1_9MICO|nr:vWA domain-containing protein [Occultella glacieicola]TDE95981.1 VWA domain-containing protein [Occultella glacieicola]
MTDQNFTHIAFLLDRSGSMQSIRSDTVGGFDAFIAEQRGEPGRCTVSLAQFDDEYQEVYADRPIADVPSLDLVPRGRTAMLDAIGRLINATGARLAALPEDQRPGTVIVGIMTDGLENASREFTRAQIKAMIGEQTDRYGWQFLYMGANQDAIEVGTGLGVDPGLAVTYAATKVDAAMRMTSRKVAGVRAAMAAGMAAPAARAAHGYTEAERAQVGEDGTAG